MRDPCVSAPFARRCRHVGCRVFRVYAARVHAARVAVDESRVPMLQVSMTRVSMLKSPALPPWRHAATGHAIQAPAPSGHVLIGSIRRSALACDPAANAVTHHETAVPIPRTKKLPIMACTARMDCTAIMAYTAVMAYTYG